MKKHLKWAAAVLLLCAAFTLSPPLSRATETGRTISVESGADLAEAVRQARDGDTIVLSGGCTVKDPASADAPWVIDKAVTIRGGSVTLWVGGILLGADVTFQDTSLSFDGYIRNAVMANGHTLVLDNVTCPAGSRPLNLFCGGLYGEAGDGFQASSGGKGTVILRGGTSLRTGEGCGNLYGGNLCMGGLTEDTSTVNGPANTMQGDALISVETARADLGGIYAGGAQQKIPAGAAAGKVILTDPDSYKVSGSVSIRLPGGAVRHVDGRGAGEAHVFYADSGSGSETELFVEELSSLTVESGHAALAGGGSFRDGAALSVLPGAKLNLTRFGDLTAGSFTGGGQLFLDGQQTLTVTGPVDGKTAVQIGSVSFVPPEDRPYIRAPQSTEGSFTLLPPSSRPDMGLVKNEDVWTVAGGQADVDPIIVKDLRFMPDTVPVSGEVLTDLELGVTYEENKAPLLYLSLLPLEIQVNGKPAVPGEYTDEYGYVYSNYVCATEYGELSLELTSDGQAEYLTAATKAYTEGDYETPLPDGIYRMTVTVPGVHTLSGEPLSASVKLLVGDVTDPGEGENPGGEGENPGGEGENPGGEGENPGGEGENPGGEGENPGGEGENPGGEGENPGGEGGDPGEGENPGGEGGDPGEGEDPVQPSLTEDIQVGEAQEPGVYTVTIHIAAPGGPVPACTVMAAVYDAHGRLLCFTAVPVDGQEEVPVSLRLAGGTEIRAFLADSLKSMSPLCGSQALSLEAQ